MQYRDNPEGRAHSLGFGGVQFGDWERMYGALVEWVNKTGGSAGRRLVPVLHRVSGNDRALQAQQTCTAWTEDTKVFVAVPFGIREALVSCLTRRGVVVVNDIEPPDAQMYSRYADALFSPGQLSLTAGAGLTVDALHADGFFRGDVRIGLARLDTPEHERAMNDGTIPALRRHGLRLTETGALSSADNGPQMSNLLLRFATAGVNRVLFIDERGNLAIFFPIAAEAQSYRPLYGLNTHSVPGITQDFAPPGQLAGARGVGWAPMADVDAANDPGPSPTRRLCNRIYAEAGVQHPSRLAETESVLLCSELLFVDHVLDRARSLTVNDFRTAAEAADDTGYASPFAMATRLEPGRHIGSAAYRLLHVDGACGCWRYRGTSRTIR